MGPAGGAACRSPARWIRCRTGSPTPSSATSATPPRSKSTLVGPELEFDDERIVAVTGATSTSVARRQAGAAQRGVHGARPARGCGFGERRLGARAYLAFAGGIDVRADARQPRDAPDQRDGRHRRTGAARGDRLPLGESTGLPTAAGQRAPIVPLPDRHAPRARAARVRRPSTCAATRSTSLQSAPYVIAQNSDRMGFRLEGPPLAHPRGADIISDATPLGVAAGAGVRAADPADGRSADDRRLSEDRDRDHRRYSASPVSSRPATRSRSRCARRGRRWPR